MITGFVPSYELDSDIGKKIAKLKGLEKGWHYPTFLLYYIRNPGPLLLFDEIVVDEGAARKAIEYVLEFQPKPMDARAPYERRVVDVIRPTESEIQTFHHLIDSKLFRKEKVVEMVTDRDFQRIKRGYIRDRYTDEFLKAIAVMKNRYGRYYALPTPELFEAMNMNVTWVMLEKLSAIPLDDILRSPLYEYKAIKTMSSGMKTMKTAYDMVDQARQVLYLPTQPLGNIDDFLGLHGDPRVRKFREKVRDFSKKEINSREISRKIHDGNLELRKLEINNYTVLIALFGIIMGLTSMDQGNFATGLVGTAKGLLLIGNEIRKVMQQERYGWLEIVKGLCEI